MGKQILIEDITSKLSQIGIPVQHDNGADITIYAELLDAKSVSGNRKIQYQLSAFFDDAKKTLFFWELTKETGSGLLFTGSSESSFQSGVTMYRHVKGVAFGADGKSYEYELDLGAITKAFKETAEQYGWKFKVVLSKAKASFPAGYIPASPQPQQQSQPEQPVQYSAPAPVQMKMGTGLLFWLLFCLTTVITLILFISGSVEIVGWLLFIAITVIIFLLGYKHIIKGTIFVIICFVVVGIINFIILGSFATTGTDAVKSEQKGDPREAVFAVSSIRTFMYASTQSKVVNYESLYKPFAAASTFLDFQAFSTDEQFNVKQISFDNIKITNKPKKGTLTYYFGFENPTVDDTKYTSQSSYSKDYSSYNYIAQSFSVFMKVDNVSDFFDPKLSIVASDKVLGLVATWQDVKFTLEFDMNVKTANGDKYSKHIVISMPQGDFMNDENAINNDINYNMQNDSDKAKAMLIKK